MKIIKKVLAVTLLITVILIGTAMPVNAVSPPIGAVEMLAEGLAMEMGIGAGLEFASSSAAQGFAEGLYQAFKDDIDDLLMTASVIYTGVVGGYKLVANVGADLWSQVRSWVGENFNVGPNTMPDDVDVDLSTLPTQKFALSVPLYWIYGSTNYKAEMTANGQDVRVYYKSGSDWQSAYMKTVGTGNPCYYAIDANNKLNFYRYESSPNGLFSPAFGYTSGYQTIPVETGITGTTGIVDNPNHDLINVGTGGRDIGIDVLPVPPTEADIPISDSIGFDLSGTLYDDAVGRDYTDVQAVPVVGTNVGSLSEIEYVDTWTEAEGYQVNLTEIFPFCIPFDIISLFQAFAAEPVAPVVDYAFIVPSLGVNVPITVDLSIFDTVAAIVRTCELVAFALGLMFITYKVIKW